MFDSRACSGGYFEGIEAIAAFFAPGKPPHPALHHMTNCFVFEEDGEVKVKMKWLVPNPENESFFGGENTDTVVKTPDGWRVKRRVATIKYPKSLMAALGLV